jgi:3-hydroxyisobutyrate dehydrogenase-like beta-hydroxyacid dehydrogenase
MLAAKETVLERAAPVLAALADKRFHVSQHPGDGACMKLVNNLLAGINLAAGAEVLAMGENLGLDPQLMLAVIGASSGQSWIVDERMRRAFAGDFEPRAHARILLKDVTLALGMAQAAGCDATLGESALALFRETVERGWGAEDDAVLLRTARDRIAEKAAGKNS